MPKISIIVPVYNTEPYLRECLDCIKVQTFKDFDAILVDDGSTDRSGEICDEYAKIDSRFKVIHKANGGVSAARNEALDIATGEFIGFVDSDDTVLPRMLETYIRIAGEYNADIVRSNGPVVASATLKPSKVEIFDIDKALDEFFKIGKVRPSLGLGIFRRTLFDGIRFPEDIYQWEDYAINAVLVSRSKKVAITDERFYNYIYHAGSATKRPMTERHLSCLLIDEYLQRYNVYRNKQDQNDVVGFFVRCCCMNYFSQPPIDKDVFRKRIRDEIKKNLKAFHECSAVPLETKLIVYTFLWSDSIANYLYCTENLVIEKLIQLRNYWRNLRP